MCWAETIDSISERDIITRLTCSTVFIRTPNGLGSGFVICTNGYILTNHHVIEGAPRALVEFHDGRRFPVHHVAAHSAQLDLAMLKIDPGTYETLSFERPDAIHIGEPIFVMGHPYGHRWTLTKGYVAGKRIDRGRSIIQFSADISPGNSGGPVVNSRGNVCGIATYVERRSIRFNDGVYVIDPSSVLKFGMSVDSFITITNRMGHRSFTLAELAARDARLKHLNFVAAVLEISDELWRDLHRGLSGLRFDVRRQYSRTHKDLRGNYIEIGSQTIIFDHQDFVESAVMFNALGKFMHEIVSKPTDNPQINQAVAIWRDSMNHGIRSINSVLEAEGKSEQAAKVLIDRSKMHFNRGADKMSEALRAAQAGLNRHHRDIVDPMYDVNRIWELADYYHKRSLRF